MRVKIPRREIILFCSALLFPVASLCAQEVGQEVKEVRQDVEQLQQDVRELREEVRRLQEELHGFRRNKKRLRLPQLRNGLRLKMVVVIVGDKDQVRVVGGVRNLVRVKV